MRRVVPELFMLTGLPVGRVYLIYDGAEATLIDASVGFAAKLILRQLGKMNIQPQQLKRILITHAHPDHVGALPDLVKETGAEVWASALERPVIEGEIPIPMPPKESLKGFSRFMRPGTTYLPPVKVARELEDGELLPNLLGGLQVVATPGHAPGHISFFQPEQKIIILGDVIFRFPTGMRLPFAALTVDMAENLRSLKKVALLDPAIVCFGHGTPLMVDTAATIRQFAQKVGAL